MIQVKNAVEVVDLVLEDDGGEVFDSLPIVRPGHRVVLDDDPFRADTLFAAVRDGEAAFQAFPFLFGILDDLRVEVDLERQFLLIESLHPNDVFQDTDLWRGDTDAQGHAVADGRVEPVDEQLQRRIVGRDFNVRRGGAQEQGIGAVVNFPDAHGRGGVGGGDEGRLVFGETGGGGGGAGGEEEKDGEEEEEFHIRKGKRGVFIPWFRKQGRSGQRS